MVKAVTEIGQEEVYEVRKRIKLDHQVDASAAGPSTSANTGNTGLHLGEDFIAFAFEEETTFSSNKTESSFEDRKGKGKENGVSSRNGGNDQRRGSGGSKRTLRDMLEDNDPKYPLQNEHITPWTSKVDWERCRDVSEMLQEEVLAFVDWITPTPVEHETRQMVVEQIRRQVVGLYNDATVHPFGSFATGLYMPSGDIDLVIQIQSAVDVVHVLRSLAKRLQRNGIAKNIQVISAARVPIIKFCSVLGEFLVDISINQDNGIKAGQLVNRYLIQFPALRALVVVVKAYLLQRSLNEVYMGGLGSYSIVLMGLSFLQMHPRIRNGEIDPLKNIGVLVVEFFEFYGLTFNYDQVGISIHDGGCYFSKMDRGWTNLRQPYLLSIEDPFDTSNDVSKSSHGIMRVKQAFAGAFYALSQGLVQRAGELNDKRTGWKTRRGKDVDADDDDDVYRSLLVAVASFSRDDQRKRHGMTELYDSEKLHRLLNVKYVRHPQAPRYLVSLRDLIKEKRSSRHSHRRRSRSRSPSHHHRRSRSPKVEERGKDRKDKGRVKESSQQSFPKEKLPKEEQFVNDDGSIVTNAPPPPTPTTGSQIKKASRPTTPKGEDGSDDEDTRYGILESSRKTRRGMNKTKSKSDKKMDKLLELEFVTDDDMSDGVKIITREVAESDDGSVGDGKSDEPTSSSQGNGIAVSVIEPRDKTEDKGVEGPLSQEEEEGEIQEIDPPPNSAAPAKPSVSRGNSAARRDYWSAKGGFERM